MQANNSSAGGLAESDIFIFVRDGEARPRFSYHSRHQKSAAELARLIPGCTALRLRHGTRIFIDEPCPAGEFVLFPYLHYRASHAASPAASSKGVIPDDQSTESSTTKRRACTETEPDTTETDTTRVATCPLNPVHFAEISTV